MKNLKFTLKAWPVIALATIGLCFITTLVAKLFGVTLNDQASLDFVKRMAGWNWPFAQVLLMVLVFAPVGEELVFRGLLWRLPAWGNRWLSVVLAVLSSALFSAAHYLQMPWPDNAFLALFFFGLAQCWLYRKAGKWHGIWCPMLNHALFNLTNLVLLFTVPESWMS